MPLVSIVIPTYKRVSTLRETLDSAIRQTGNHNYEILVVDNNPERGDETELLMAEYVSVKNLLYFKNTANIGMAGNWSRCSELAHGEWVVLIHDDDLLRVINELRAAGAEAIAINGERIVAMSEIRCAGPTLSVNNNRSAPPYEIKAIGNPNNLESALKLRGGVLENFKFWGIQADLSQSDDIVIPAFKGRKSFEYAKIAEGQASDAEKEAAEK